MESSICGCGKPAHKLCGGCEVVRYCSRECQVLDWPQHKKICKARPIYDLVSRDYLMRILNDPEFRHKQYPKSQDEDVINETKLLLRDLDM